MGADANLDASTREAAKRGDVEMLEMLISEGADVNRLGEEGRTPVFYASDLKTARFLVNQGAELNTDVTGNTPLIYSIMYNSAPVVR